MRPTTTVSQGSFASQMNQYLARLVASRDGDKSGRWLERVTDNARSRDYWANLISDSRAMNTNDIQILGAVFDLTPLEFVQNARAGIDTPTSLDDHRRRRDVGADTEDLREVASESITERPEDTDDQY